MDNLQLKQVPIAKTGMLIRKPVADVFKVFINPDITTKFWFTKSSGRLEVGKQVQWDWEMYGISIPVTAKVIEANKRIVIEWAGIRQSHHPGMDLRAPGGWHNVHQHHERWLHWRRRRTCKTGDRFD